MRNFNSLQKRAGGFIALSLLATSVPALAADYAPIDCSKASLPAERTICRTYTLGQVEARMATLFAVATSLVGMGQRADIADAQRKWLDERNACASNAACLTRTYRSRIDALSAIIDTVASRGPF